MTNLFEKFSELRQSVTELSDAVCELSDSLYDEIDKNVIRCMKILNDLNKGIYNQVDEIYNVINNDEYIMIDQYIEVLNELPKFKPSLGDILGLKEQIINWRKVNYGH